MTLRVTFDIFSGRPNPVVDLDAADSARLLARLQPAANLRGANAVPPRESILGYRGLIVEQVGRASSKLPQKSRVVNGRLFAPKTAWRLRSADVEDFILGLPAVARSKAFPKDLIALLRNQAAPTNGTIGSDSIFSSSFEAPVKKCPCAPLYEPDWWNSPDNSWQIMVYNNCYNYACNYRTDTFAQPGRASGQMYEALTCAAVKPAALRDDLMEYGSKTIRCPKEGTLVSLVIFPGGDFHWYRMGRDGLWTHKPGGTPVTNLDNSGNLITDPRNADRGPYTDFCSFMIVMHGHIKIN
jgi:hypothetical protein